MHIISLYEISHPKSVTAWVYVVNLKFFSAHKQSRKAFTFIVDKRVSCVTTGEC